MALYILKSTNFEQIFGTGIPGVTGYLPPKPDVFIIGQRPDCSEFLVISYTVYAGLDKQEEVPEGFDFTYCQDWGLIITDGIIYRVEQDLRAKAYPSIPDQLDVIFHSGIDAWKASIQLVKDKYPKV